MAVHQQASTGEMVEDGKVQAASKGPQLVDGKPVIHLKIYSPYKVYFNDVVFSISAENATGPFDILPEHHNFISLINPCELHVFAPQGESRIRISGGLLFVQSQDIKVFLDI